MQSKSRLIYFIEYSGLFILLLFASAVYLDQGIIDLFFNSDELTSVLFFKDLFFDHGHYEDLIIPTVPHFFPDVFILAPIYYVVKNIYLYFLIVIWISIISIYVAVKLIYRQFFSVKKAIIFALIASGSLFLLALHNLQPYNFVLISFWHVGEFIAGLFLIGMQINLISKEKLTYNNNICYFLSAFIAFSCSLSDLLFFIQFAIPIFISYSFFFLIRRIKFYRYLLLSSLVIFPAILGVFLTKHLMPNYTLPAYLGYPSLIKVSFSTINIQFLALIQLVKSNVNYLIGIVLGIFYLGLIFILTKQLFFKDKENIKNCSDKKLFLSLFIFLSVFFSIASQFYLVGAIYVATRYMLPLFFFPFLLFFFLVNYLNNKLLTSRIVNYLAGLFFIYIIASLLVFISKPGLKIHMSYYPQYIHCIDKALRGYGHVGIGQYWDAHPVSVFSKEKLEISPVIANLSPFVWAINTTKFKKPFNFIVLDMFDNPFHLDQDLIYRRYGKPDKLVICDKRKILIYSKNFTLK